MRRVRLLYVLVVCPLLALGLLAFLLSAGEAVCSHAQLDYGEGVVLWQAAHVTDWPAAYHRIEVPPYMIFHYPPVYHLVSRLVSLMTGNLLSAGRLVSALSLILVSLVLAVLSWHCFPASVDPLARRIGSVSSGLLSFTLPCSHWACFMRVDALAMLLSYSAIALFVVGRNQPRRIYLSFALFAAAVFTKQTMIAAPAACLLILYLENRRLLVRVVVSTGSVMVFALILLQRATNGAFLRNIISYNRNPFLLGRLVRLQVDQIADNGVVLAACLVLPLMYLVHLRSPLAVSARIRALLERDLFGRCVAVIAVVFVLSYAVSFTVGKLGSSYNYFFETDIAASLGAGLFLGWLMRYRSGYSGGARTMYAVFATLIFAFHAARVERVMYEAVDTIRRPPPDYSAEVVRVLKSTPGRVYSENMTILAEAGKKVEAEPFTVTSLAGTGQWDESPFVQEIEDRRFSMIVAMALTNRELFSPRVAQAIETRYAETNRIGHFVVYTPR